MKKGFTLIELLVVVAIIATLSSLGLASLSKARMRARDAQRVSDLNRIKIALELYYEQKGHYPPVACGFDCNGYSLSYNATWTTLANELAPYIAKLPVDPRNSPSCAPWNANCYTYSYGNVGRSTYPSQYDLTAQLEDVTNPLTCANKSYRFYFDNRLWCPPYSSQVYEIGP